MYGSTCGLTVVSFRKQFEIAQKLLAEGYRYETTDGKRQLISGDKVHPIPENVVGLFEEYVERQE